MLIKALVARDVPMIMGAGLVIGLMYAVVNMIADLACIGLDPSRLRGAPA